MSGVSVPFNTAVLSDQIKSEIYLIGVNAEAGVVYIRVRAKRHPDVHIYQRDPINLAGALMG